jgi:hypothetical protein
MIGTLTGEQGIGSLQRPTLHGIGNSDRYGHYVDSDRQRVHAELSELADREFQGVPLGEVVGRLVREHKINKVVCRYEELRADPDEWASYQAELSEADGTVSDGLLDGRDEHPDYDR